MTLPEWLQHELNNREMARYNHDPENRRDRCSDPDDFDRRAAEVRNSTGTASPG